MLTPQEAADHAFPRRMMGGYSMSDVDDFLDELIDDYTALYKENTALKAKLKVLVEKVEDYRSTEDSMRATLLTAQKMADAITKEAEEKRDAMLSEAENASRERLEIMQAELAETETRIRMGRDTLDKFRQEMQTLLNQQLAFLEQLPVLPLTPPSAPASDAAQPPIAGQIEASILAAFAADRPSGTDAAAAPDTSAASESAVVPESPAAADDDPTDGADAQPPPGIPDDEPTRRISLQHLDDLQFGRNYPSASDGAGL